MVCHGSRNLSVLRELLVGRRSEAGGINGALVGTFGGPEDHPAARNFPRYTHIPSPVNASSTGIRGQSVTSCGWSASVWELTSALGNPLTNEPAERGAILAEDRPGGTKKCAGFDRNPLSDAGFGAQENTRQYPSRSADSGYMRRGLK